MTFSSRTSRRQNFLEVLSGLATGFLGFRGLGFRVWGLGFGVSGLFLSVWYRFQGLKCSVSCYARGPLGWVNFCRPKPDLESLLTYASRVGKLGYMLGRSPSYGDYEKEF